MCDLVRCLGVCCRPGTRGALATELFFLDVEVPNKPQQADRKCAPIAWEREGILVQAQGLFHREDGDLVLTSHVLRRSRGRSNRRSLPVSSRLGRHDRCAS